MKKPHAIVHIACVTVLSLTGASRNVTAGEDEEAKIYYVRLEQINLELKDLQFKQKLMKKKIDKKHFIHIDEHGFEVLGGLRENPGAYTMVGEIRGTVKDKHTGKILATYTLKVQQLIPGNSDRRADCHLACKGTY